MTWHEANFIFQVNYPPDIVKVKGSFRQTPLSITDKIQIHIPDAIHGNIHSDRHLYQLCTRSRYVSQIQFPGHSFWLQFSIFLTMASLSPSQTFIASTTYTGYQIQPNVRFILIQPNIWLLQLRCDLTYDPFWHSATQIRSNVRSILILPSVRYIPRCSLTYDYFLSDTA